jgi:hypothetical protein
MACLVLVVLLTSCGRVGPPQPPFIRIPEAVEDLAVSQAGYELILTWTNPPRYVDGSAATNLSRIQIRSNGASLATVNVEAAGKPQSFKMPAEPASGERTFSVVVETSQGKLSETSNIAAIMPVDVPGRISGLNVWADQRRIFLEWNRPADRPELANAYIVTRSDTPDDTLTVTETRYEDIRYQEGKAFTYHVTPARRVGDSLIPGVGTAEFTVTTEDKKAPAAPAGLEFTQSVLTWEPNAESDLAGYRVFRSDRPDGGFQEVSAQLIKSNIFTDPSYRPGLYYAVAAQDDSGNLGGRSMPLRAP